MQPSILHGHGRKTRQLPGNICRATSAAAFARPLDVSAITTYCLSTLNRTMCRKRFIARCRFVMPWSDCYATPSSARSA
ncbi:hypothetical protein CVO74_17455 [Xanthomonas prunicola]|uniref:Uncharacterized protein n=1 Tax=Xanthomonas prunicola TaxID=2053930 RepID=A0A2N3REH9_9XANT|nr:hypothetical protein XpruCFBP8353_20910 [Xanthomonas prunicola]PKV15211.1 hypothetical protein XpruCFBP8354_20685 [Xanthomonas prunicola]PKV19911.1 hypothetical protein CVO74_17455 [Xanthomonas prunicola]